MYITHKRKYSKHHTHLRSTGRCVEHTCKELSDNLRSVNWPGSAQEPPRLKPVVNWEPRSTSVCDHTVKGCWAERSPALKVTPSNSTEIFSCPHAAKWMKRNQIKTELFGLLIKGVKSSTVVVASYWCFEHKNVCPLLESWVCAHKPVYLGELYQYCQIMSQNTARNLLIDTRRVMSRYNLLRDARSNNTGACWMLLCVD